MSRFRLFFALFACLLSISHSLKHHLFNQQMQIGFEEKQGQYADLNVKLVNESGDTVLIKRRNQQTYNSESGLLSGVLEHAVL